MCSIIVGIALTITIIPLIIIKIFQNMEERKLNYLLMKNNTLNEIAIPPYLPIPKDSEFLYPHLVNDSKCIDRKQHQNEFLRVLGKDLYRDDMSDPRILIIGAGTALGAALSRRFSYKKRPYIAIKGINEVDFSSLDVEILFQSVKLRCAFIAYQPPMKQHSTTDGSQYSNRIINDYIKGLCSFLQRRNVPFAFAPNSIIEEETMTTALRAGACIVEMPLPIDSKAFYDLENPTMRAVRECRKVGYTTIEVNPHMKYTSYTADDVAKFVWKQIKHPEDLKKGRFLIYGASNATIQDAVEEAVNAAQLKCDITFFDTKHAIQPVPESYHTALVGNENANVLQMIRDEYSNFSMKEKDSPYFSIVIVGRHDSFSKGFEARAQNFINTIGENIKRVPLADIEIVFVDYATPEGKTLLHSELQIPKSLESKVRYIVVPPETHIQLRMRLNKSISFLEYIAKNIGIVRSKGKFVLTTNPDDLIPSSFFELVATRQFNTAIFYRALRWDMRDNTSKEYTIPQLAQGLNEPWVFDKWDINHRCTSSGNVFNIINDDMSFELYSNPCGTGDFVLLSKKMWEAIGGFNEFPANPNVDTVFNAKMMKMLPGYVRIFVEPLILHQKHPKKNIFRPSVEEHPKYMKEYICYGRCPKCGPFADNQYWGLSNQKFEEIIY